MGFNILVFKKNFFNIKFILLAILPISFLFACFFYFVSDFYPIYSNPIGLDQDPSYIYLFSGLSLLHGFNPNHTDHPGTPYQILFAIFIFINFIKTISFKPYILQNDGINFSTLDSITVQDSEFILKIASSFSILLISLLMFYLALLIYRNFESLTGAIFSQCFVFLLSDVNKQTFINQGNLFLNRTIYPGPEQLLIIISLLSLILITNSFSDLSYIDNNKDQKIIITFFGFWEVYFLQVYTLKSHLSLFSHYFFISEK